MIICDTPGIIIFFVNMVITLISRNELISSLSKGCEINIWFLDSSSLNVSHKSVKKSSWFTFSSSMIFGVGDPQMQRWQLFWEITSLQASGCLLHIGRGKGRCKQTVSTMAWLRSGREVRTYTLHSIHAELQIRELYPRKVYENTEHYDINGH